MKNFLHSLCIGKDSKITLVLVLSVFAFAALGCSGFIKNLSEATNTTTNIRNENTNTSTTSTPARNSNSITASGDVPSDSEINSLVEDTIQDFTDAVERGDFRDFLATTSKDFQYQFSPAGLNQSFKSFIDKKNAVVPILRSARGKTPQFSSSPEVVTEKGADGKNYKILNVKGTYPTNPSTTNFDLQYVLEESSWKVLSIKIRFE